MDVSTVISPSVGSCVSIEEVLSSESVDGLWMLKPILVFLCSPAPRWVAGGFNCSPAWEDGEGVKVCGLIMEGRGECGLDDRSLEVDLDDRSLEPSRNAPEPGPNWR